MRVPTTGGKPQLVFSGRIYGLRCARSRSDLCVIAERSPDGKQLIFTAFRPINGRGRKLERFPIDSSGAYLWDLSQDGAQIAVVTAGKQSIDVLDLHGRAPLEITASGGGLETLNWSADGKGFFAASRAQESSLLLYIDLKGRTHTVWEKQGTLGNEAAGTSGIPSPDGRHSAMMDFTHSANMWAIESF